MKITRNFVKLISVMLIIAIMSFAFSSCGSSDNGSGNGNDKDNAKDADNSGNKSDGGDGENGDSGDADNQESDQLDILSVLASLPDADYDGYEFRIWTSNHFNTTLEGRQAPEINEAGEIYEISDPVNDALYRRDRLVEEKYNINIKYTVHAESGPVFTNAKKSINAGDDSFDYAMDKMMDSKTLAQEGLLVDFNKIPNIDLSKEWWSKYAIRDLTIDGRFYFPTGDITARYPGSQYLMLFNKKLIEDFGLDYPYQSVLSGEWTLDALFNLTKEGTLDLNGDGELNKKDDRFGLVVETMAPMCFLHACGEGLTKIVDGNPVFNVKTDRTLAIIDKLASVWTDPYYVYLPKGYNTYDEVPIFKEDRALFAAMTGTNALLFKDMESDFGIVPLPKFDANQDEYYSFCQAWGSAAVCVPITTANIERTGMIIEAMAAGGRYTSTPAAYDITFKIKYARDEESSQMLDIITDGSVYDFAFIYDWGSIYSSLCTTVAKGDSYLTKFESAEGKAESAMEKTINAFINAE